MNNMDRPRHRITPSLASRRCNIIAGIFPLVIASYITFILLWGIYNIIIGLAKLFGALFYIILLGLLDAWLLFFVVMFLQPEMILYDDHFKLRWAFKMKTRIAFKDIDKFYKIRGPNNNDFFGFILKDGSRSYITADFDENFIKEFIQRMESHGLGSGEPLTVDDIGNFYNVKEYEFEKLEKQLLEQARAERKQ